MARNHQHHSPSSSKTSSAPSDPPTPFSVIDDPSAASSTDANGVNDSGVIVGTYADSTNHSHGFIDNRGVFTTLDVSGATNTLPFSVNNGGTIVGVTNVNNQQLGFIDANGTITTYKVPVSGSAYTALTGINNNGEIVGSYFLPDNYQRGFILNNGTVTSFDAPASRDTTPAGVNDQGVIVGSYLDTSLAQHGFIYSNGTITTLDFPDETRMSPTGIDNAGDIVGSYSTIPSGLTHGFLYQHGSFTTIDVSGAEETAAYGINNDGEIVGSYRLQDGSTHGFSVPLTQLLANTSAGVADLVPSIAATTATTSDPTTKGGYSTAATDPSPTLLASLRGHGHALG